MKTHVVLRVVVFTLGSDLLAADPPTIWVQNCTMCHGRDGSGNIRMGKQMGTKDFRDANVQVAFSDAEAERAIKEGVKENGAIKMPSFQHKLSDVEIKALLGYIRSLKN